ncbi:MAG: hypothetical protein A2W31_03670 [Planctomycetes bacterium RBG_16_64_10]|nr:MAG: hypothetical protein A2W31_03670 [Planctomycetes bacterium RBG_16_64_10]
MNERVLQFRVGVVVVATAIIVAILIVLFGEAPTIMGPHYTLKIRLPQAPGIVADSPVRKSGITIGRVQAVEFDVDGTVLVTAAIEKDQRLTTSDQCRAKGTLLGGDASLDFTRQDGAPLDAPPYQDGAVVQGLAAADPLDVLSGLRQDLADLPAAIDSVRQAGEHVGVLAKRIDVLLVDNEQHIHDLLEGSGEALDVIADAAKKLANLLEDPQIIADLQKSMSELPQVLVQTRATMQSIEEAAQIAKKDLEAVHELSPLFGRIGEKADAGLDELSDVFTQLQIFSEAINDQQGTLGQVLHNPELYQNLNRAVIHVERLSSQLRPILDDVRIFTDKIARDPGRLGVRGVLRKPGGLK